MKLDLLSYRAESRGEKVSDFVHDERITRQIEMQASGSQTMVTYCIPAKSPVQPL